MLIARSTAGARLGWNKALYKGAVYSSPFVAISSTELGGIPSTPIGAPLLRWRDDTTHRSNCIQSKSESLRHESKKNICSTVRNPILVHLLSYATIVTTEDTAHARYDARQKSTSTHFRVRLHRH